MSIKVGAIALMKNENDEILMLLRKKEPAKGFWAIPGGNVELYEKLEDTIIREMKEELDVEVEVTKFLCNIQDINEEKDLHWIMPVYEARIVNGTLRNVEPDKHEDMRWFKLSEIPTNISYMTDMVLKAIKK
ncbi:MAG: NUDIX domain-containing protein [Oscillospiraceae bacterium]|nr:NUDIX domain-containing protein [Oscillospiraceae bacterium]